MEKEGRERERERERENEGKIGSSDINFYLECE